MSTERTEPWSSRLFGSYSHDFLGEPPETYEGILPSVNPFNSRPLCGMVDVTRGSFTGVADYTTMSLDDAMRIYWLSKRISASGSTSFSASSSGGGTFEIYSQVRVPDSNPAEYEAELTTSWTEQVSASVSSGNVEFSTKEESGPYQPRERVCASKFYSQLLDTPESSEFDNEYKPSIYQGVSATAEGNSYRISYDEYGYDSEYHPIYGFQPTYPLPQIVTLIPTPPLAFYDSGQFVGWGFAHPFVMIDCRVGARASYDRPFIPIRGGGAYIGERGNAFIEAGGQMYLGNVSYRNEDIGDRYLDYDFELSRKSITVQYMGVDLLFTTQAEGDANSFDPTNKVNIESGNGIKISFSDSVSKSPNGDADSRNSIGVGKVFTGGGEISASVDFEINISEPEFYDYPESE